MNGFSLYEINSEYNAILSAAEHEAMENEGVISDVLSDALDQISLDREQKIINCAHFYKNKSAESDAIAAEIKKLQARKKMCDAATTWIKENILQNCVREGERFSCPTVAISWRASKSVVITDEKLIPEELCKITILPSKTAIKKAIESGENVDGATLENRQNIQIK